MTRSFTTISDLQESPRCARVSVLHTTFSWLSQAKHCELQEKMLQGKPSPSQPGMHQLYQAGWHFPLLHCKGAATGTEMNPLVLVLVFLVFT